MDFSTAVKLASQAHLRDQPTIILELVNAYEERVASAGTSAQAFAYGYVAALEWVLQVRSRESFNDVKGAQEGR